MLQAAALRFGRLPLFEVEVLCDYRDHIEERLEYNDELLESEHVFVVRF